MKKKRVINNIEILEDFDNIIPYQLCCNYLYFNTLYQGLYYHALNALYNEIWYNKQMEYYGIHTNRQICYLKPRNWEVDVRLKDIITLPSEAVSPINLSHDKHLMIYLKTSLSHYLSMLKYAFIDSYIKKPRKFYLELYKHWSEE